jgi:spore maturation protein CgeB
VKFLILNTDYPKFLDWLYAQHPRLEQETYEEQMRVRMESLFGDADFYSSNLRKLGHEAYDLRASNEWMQKAWAYEQGILGNKPLTARQRAKSILRSARQSAGKTPLRHLKPLFHPVLRSLDRHQSWFYEILAAQIKYHEPDVLLNLAMDSISTSFLREMKGYVDFLIGWSEPPVLLNQQDWRVYDLIAAPSEGLVDYFRDIGMKTELLRFGFEPRVLSMTTIDSEKKLPVSFVGSMGGIHLKRQRLLEVICTEFGEGISIWAPLIDDTLKPIVRDRYQGPAWGGDLYRIMSTSKVTLNCHIDIAGRFADNMRLYEATGVGTLLITDWKENLHEIFELGREVVEYRTPEECAELIHYYLDHDDEREAIAYAGQQRTLRDHTCFQRMQDLAKIVDGYL